MKATSSPPGLVHALLLDGEGGATDYPQEAMATWTQEQGSLWLHFDFEEPGAINWLRHSSGLSDIASRALVNPETRPRALNRGDNLLLSLRGLNLSPGQDPEDMVAIRLWTNGHKIISSRRRELVSTQDMLDAFHAGNGPRNATELLVQWIDRIVSRMSDTITGFEDELLDMEERVLAGESEGIRLNLSQLRRQTLAIRRYLAPQREAMNRLASENLTWLDDTNRLRLREVNDRLIRHIEDIDALRERAALAQEELLSRISEQINQRSYVFTVVATIFLPLGFFTGLMGINVGGMPGVESDQAFWVVVFLCVFATLCLTLLFRFKRWM